MGIFSAEAHRCSDIINLAVISGQVGRWIAIRLSDGGWDGTVYDHRADAVSHQLHENLCAYVQVVPGGMNPQEAQAYLDYHRALYDEGFRLPDPEFQPPLMPLTARDQMRQIRTLTKGR